jgi:UDP-N-acetylmuramyl pentapeptide synthase
MAGMNPESIHFFESPEVAATVLKPVIGPEDVVLVKGSRAASLDSIVDTLCEVTV